MNVPETFETDRLRLRKPVIEDAEQIFVKYAQDPVVTQYLIWKPHKSIDETRDFMRRCINSWVDGSAYPWIIIRKADNQLLGMIELRINGYIADFGYVLAREYWRNGYTSEASKAVVDWALGQPEIYRVWAICNVENTGSARVMEKVGMQREGILRRRVMHPAFSAEPSDAYCYSIVK
ncbi:MAG TPA: GNAT family N-acetyltransferase [Blastocatellia bacterium]|nr:GNAT family N-acetyltransferase [Blastocatellia bacterium]